MVMSDTSGRTLRVAVLIKQVPRFEGLTLGADGRLDRSGVELEMNPYCRRAVSKGVELARESGGTCTSFTLGPPAAEDVLRESVAWGVDEGILVSDPAFGGSDTLATARALAAALRMEGPFDLILVGLNSVDADTGQVGPSIAQLLELPFLSGVRVLNRSGETLRTYCEFDDGWAESDVEMPVVLSSAERLCDPAKVNPAGRAAVSAGRIRRLSAADLGDGPWGQDGSLTRVGDVRVIRELRLQSVLAGSLSAQVKEAVAILVLREALVDTQSPTVESTMVPDAWTRGSSDVVVVLESGRPRVCRELLGAAAGVAQAVGGRVVAVGPADPSWDERSLGCWGADEVVLMEGSPAPGDVASTLSSWFRSRHPWAVFVSGTMRGREIAARIATCVGAGLTGDVVEFTVEVDRLICWKPAFGGALVAAISATSPIQMATVRPGMLGLPAPRAERSVLGRVLTVAYSDRIRQMKSGRDDDFDRLSAASVVIGLGRGVRPEDYPLLDDLRAALGGAELGATRKVTDEGWMPRSRQIGITGRSIAPNLYLALGIGGKFNHSVGVRGAGTVLAINVDPNAAVFKQADIGIVGDWRAVAPLFVEELHRHVSAVV